MGRSWCTFGVSDLAIAEAVRHERHLPHAWSPLLPVAGSHRVDLALSRNRPSAAALSLNLALLNLWTRSL